MALAGSRAEKTERMMQLTFLGTAAAQGYPNPFCRCDNCERARALGGPSLRKRSAALIGADLLIDLGPDLIAASFLHGRSLAGVRFCLQTHAHDDHLDPSHLLSRSPEYGVPAAPRLHLYGSAATVGRIASLLADDVAPASLLDPAVGERLNLAVHRIESFQTFEAGPYRVTAYPANHGPAGATLLYAVETGGRTLFYGTDTGPLAEDTWDALRQRRPRFDVVVLDHTYGETEGTDDHLNAARFVEHMARFREEGLLAGDARVLATHLSHDANAVHPDLAVSAARRGYEIAYDGLSV
jgi:phosphoribosyl 1,2-cyclic phosphate phosphodiesterase